MDFFDESWKSKPVEEWTMFDAACYEFHEMCREHDEALERGELDVQRCS